MWYDLAASQLCCQMLQSAIENRYRVGSLMNSTQVAEARCLARQWDAAHRQGVAVRNGTTADFVPVRMWLSRCAQVCSACNFSAS